MYIKKFDTFLNEKKKFRVFNQTDKVYASSKRFKDEKSAYAFIDEFRESFKKQGYYLTAKQERIAPEEIELIIEGNANSTNYYTTAEPMTIDDFIEIEVEDRGNYDIDDVNEWIDKYKIESDTELLWVAASPHIAARYQMPAEDWDNAKEIYEKNPGEYNVRTVSSKTGTIIEESDDGDDGFIFVLR